MALRNIALIKNGAVVNTVIVEDDPANWPGYVRACNPPVTDVLAQLAVTHDCDVVELADGEMCEPGALVKTDTAPELVAREGEKLGVVKLAADQDGKALKPAVERFERTSVVEAAVGVKG